MPEREERLLDAAIDVIGNAGMRALTHRAVDIAAGLPLGSTSNRFRTREALLRGVLRRILVRETELWSAVAAERSPTDATELSAAFGALVRGLTGRHATLARARSAVFVEAGHQPALRAEIATAIAELSSWMTPLLAGAGSDDPERDVQHLLALLGGLEANQLASGSPDFDPEGAIAALLRGLGDGTARRRRT